MATHLDQKPQTCSVQTAIKQIEHAHNDIYTILACLNQNTGVREFQLKDWISALAIATERLVALTKTRLTSSTLQKILNQKVENPVHSICMTLNEIPEIVQKLSALVSVSSLNIEEKATLQAKLNEIIQTAEFVNSSET